MSASNVLSFCELQPGMTVADGLAYIARTRRQLDRFTSALSHVESKAIDPEEANAIRGICDKVEAHILRLLGTA